HAYGGQPPQGGAGCGVSSRVEGQSTAALAARRRNQALGGRQKGDTRLTSSSMTQASPSGPETLRMGRRLYRGIVFALFVGIAAAALSAVPSLFVQSVFVVESERCADAQRQDI